MTLEQLRIFVAVAEREHVTQAARALNLTQSAVSAAIAALEAGYATKLFNRVGRRIALTQAGQQFLSEARAVLARAATAEAVLADLAELKRGALAVAASQTVTNYWLPPLMRLYRETYPNIALSLKIGTTGTVADMVRDGLVDLGFVEGIVDEPALTVTPVAEDELIVVVSTRLSQPKKLAFEELKHLRWVFRERGSATRAIFEDALKEAGIKLSDLNIVLELPSNEAVRTAIEDGAGAAVLSRLVVADALEAGSLVRLDVPLPKRQFFSLRHKERYATAAERAFRQMIGR